MTDGTARAVLFDLDGVIVDTKAFHFASFQALGEEAGYTMSPEQFRSVFGRHNRDIFPMLYGRALPAEEIQRLSDRKEAIFRDLLRGKVMPLPGVCALLPALRAAGWRMGIGSSTPHANIDMILGALGIAAYFDGIASAEDVTRGKPDPQVFLIAATRVRVAPAQCVVVEDAVAGVEAAHRGGMRALGVTTNHSREALAAADRVVDSLAEMTPADFQALLPGV